MVHLTLERRQFKSPRYYLTMFKKNRIKILTKCFTFELRSFKTHVKDSIIQHTDKPKHLKLGI